MQMSLTEAAAALGKTPRQVRYLIENGSLRAQKKQNRWVIESTDLPLSGGQRKAVAGQVEAARVAFEKGVEPAAKASEDAAQKKYSVTDLAAFRIGADLHRELAASLGPEAPACGRLATALSLVAKGCHSFHPNDKARHFTEARDLLATLTVELLLHGDEARRPFARRIEEELIPRVGGLVARQEKRSRRSRFERFGSSVEPVR